MLNFIKYMFYFQMAKVYTSSKRRLDKKQDKIKNKKLKYQAKVDTYLGKIKTYTKSI